MKKFMFALVAAFALLGASPVALAGHGSGAAWFAGGFLFGNAFAPRVETVYYAPPPVVYSQPVVYAQPVVYSQPVAPVAVAAPVTVTYVAPPPATVVYAAPPPVTVYYAPSPVLVAPVYYRHRHFRCW